MPQDADVIDDATRLILYNELVAARQLLNALSQADPIVRPSIDVATPFERIPGGASRPLTDALRFEVYKRDGWRCRYCHRKIVVRTVLYLLRVIFPDFKGATPGYAFPKADTEPGIERVYPQVDHVHPQSYGGSSDLTNLVTSCDNCNRAKSNGAGWKALPIFKDEWRGLLPVLAPLAVIAKYDSRTDWWLKKSRSGQ